MDTQVAQIVRNDDRKYSLDLLRILASFMVVWLHVSAEYWYSVSVFSNEWRTFNFYDSAVRSAVPLFFMMSGQLFLSKPQMSPISELIGSKILKLGLVYIFWSILYAIDTIGIDMLFAENGFRVFLATVAASKYHLWFLPAMMGIYFILPILYSLSRYDSGKYLAYGCAVFFVFSVLFGTLRLGGEYIPFNSLPVLSLINEISYELIGYSGYFLLGYYLSTKDYKKIKYRYLLLLLFITIITSTIIGRMHAEQQGAPTGLLYGYLTLPVFLEAVLLFVIFSKLDYTPSGRLQKVIKTVSKSTFVIYLIHVFFLEHIRIWFDITQLSFNAWLSVPIFSLWVFFLSLIVGVILNKIPIVNKWLI